MIVAGGQMRDFGYYLARSNAIMYNIIGLMDNRRTEDITGFSFCDFHLCIPDDSKITAINTS
jgi:hypothetical protein